MNWILIGLMSYVALQLAIGVYVSRRNASEDDYLVAGRRLGFPITMMTVFATWFGAETCISAAGKAYDGGLSGGRADPFGYALCILLMGAFFATVFWRRKLTTIADLFRMEYGGRVEKLVVLLMVPTSVLWAAAQIRAFGQVLMVSSGWPLQLTITFAAAVVMVYTVMGGLLADAVTDFVQGIVLIGGILMLGVVVWLNWPEASVLEPALSPERWSLTAPGESWLGRMEAWSIPIVGSLFAQELVSRTLAARTPGIARGATLSAGVLYLCVGLIPLMLGLMGPALIPNLADGETFLPMLAQEYLHPVMYTIFAGAIISAILSTVDSNLLACSALVSHNVVLPLRPGLGEREKVRVARVMVVVFGLIAYGLAQGADRVYTLVEEASAFGSAGIFTVIMFALGTRLGGALSAGASLLAGVAVYGVGAYYLELAYPYLLSVAASVAGYLLISVFEPKRVKVELTAQPEGT